jgi:hypothetical protein
MDHIPPVFTGVVPAIAYKPFEIYDPVGSIALEGCHIDNFKLIAPDQLHMLKVPIGVRFTVNPCLKKL